ncbi:MAG TPA: FAD-dependent oxidoreductase [Bacteroidales bacterium]|jgi:dihydrolipoamide dehydrogenase|nr:FAD-dependent oxidoreductase [Bacteroidales bacterium]HOL97959.1 FAD-dependent oxidoreductase [Bacteroidales bacterium]HOM36366.1 FAD-dependent oxidoreductase [Bacteroidales bacterium]HPD23533.1 FAD-dependent oxidoreductase [Bacteroidales bacterium]HRS99161.1 FAD-dependent oxidoreductase [Bacteroidales bacterium]
MEYDLIIIGSGPGGYVAAIRAGQLGMKVLLVEKDKPGGMCLNWGCIPSKSLIESAKKFAGLSEFKKYGIEGIDLKSVSFNWQAAVKKAMANAIKLSKGIEFLLKKNAVEIILGEAKISSLNSITVENRNIYAKKIIIATGSYPQVGNSDEISIKDFYNLETLPHKIAFIGIGTVSLEFSLMAAMIGIDTYLVSSEEKIVPELDDYLNDYIQKLLKKNKVKLVKDISEIPVDAVKVNSRRRKAVLPESEIEIKTDENGFILTDEKLRTNYDSIFAIGDVNGKSAYAHNASFQGLFVVNTIKGIDTTFCLDKSPINIYTYPEISQIGLTEQQLKQKKIDYKISSFPLSANGKALIEGQSEGEMRILSDKKYGEVLGVQIISDNATDMIAEAAAYMQLEATIYDVASTIHAHPTVSEIFMEAGFEAVDKAIHK